MLLGLLPIVDDAFQIVARLRIECIAIGLKLFPGQRGRLDPAGERDLLFGGQKRDTPGFLEVQADYVIGLQRLLIACILAQVGIFNRREIGNVRNLGEMAGEMLVSGWLGQDGDAGLCQGLQHLIEPGDVILMLRWNRRQDVVIGEIALLISPGEEQVEYRIAGCFCHRHSVRIDCLSELHG